MTAWDRQEARRRWAAAAPGWGAHADAVGSSAMPVAVWLVEAIAPQPGHTILELAAGPGDVGFLAAELIAPGGTLITSDFVPEMLSVAQERAARLGLRNVRFRQIDAETAIDQPAASVDGVLCRWGYMLMRDPGTALQETRRVLRPDGRVALAAWAPAEDNPWARIPGAELGRRGLVAPPAPDEPGQFAWAPDGRIEEALRDAGFADVRVEDVRFTIRHPSFDAWWEVTVDVSPTFAAAVGGLDAAAREELRDAIRDAAAGFRAPDGSYALPARTWVAVATA